VQQSGPSKQVSSSSAADEIAALLAIKRVLDPPGTALTEWRPGSATACGWAGVVCRPDKKVAGIFLLPNPAAVAHGEHDFVQLRLTGRLPSSVLLRRLPALDFIRISNTSLQGSLPQDWSLLTRLHAIELMDNALTGG
jgi:hypothetical protein